MMNNKHNNSGCGFAEELVSYLYGETDAVETAAFETHLQSCPVCSDELEAFSGVHFSINDWKSKEFGVLETPRVEIPYQQAEKSPAVASVEGSWLSALRDLFSLSPRGWSLATASLAVFAVTVGIALFALNSRQLNDLAESNRAVNPIAVATVEKTPEPSNSGSNPDKVTKPLNEQKPSQPELAVEPNPKNNRVVVKTSNKQGQSQKPENSNSPKNNDVKNNKKNNNDVAPVIPDEDEDNTLRLAELFEEIDTEE